MSDLTDEQLDGMSMWDDEREVMLDKRHQAVGAMLVRMAVDEIRRRRAEQAAGREHVERVVREEVMDRLLGGPAEVAQLGWEVGRAVADRLSVSGMSEEDVATLQKLRRDISGNGDELVYAAKEITGTAKEIALLDRLIAGSVKP